MRNPPLGTNQMERATPNAAWAGVIEGGMRAAIDAGLFHGRNPGEQGTQSVDAPARVPAGKRYASVWGASTRVGTPRCRELASHEFSIDRAAGMGCRWLAQPVNRMRAAQKGRIDLPRPDVTSGQARRRALVALRPGLRGPSAPAVREVLT